jgi:hypothetical protein
MNIDDIQDDNDFVDPELTDADYEFVDNLIFECATDAGFVTDGERFYSEIHGYEDITEKLNEFAALLARKVKLLVAPNTPPQ